MLEYGGDIHLCLEAQTLAKQSSLKVVLHFLKFICL